jgi:hypothetical protein
MNQPGTPAQAAVDRPETKDVAGQAAVPTRHWRVTGAGERSHSPTTRAFAAVDRPETTVEQLQADG